MTKCFFFFIFLTLSFTLHAQNLCVLVFEHPYNPIAKKINLLFSHNPDEIRLKFLAKPKEIVDCINQGAKEIIIVAHALKSKNMQEINLGYMIINKNNPQLFRWSLFLDKPFAEALKKIEANQTKIKIRWVSCQFESIVEKYPSLQKIIQSKLVIFERVPNDWLWSLFYNGQVINMDRATMRWLAKSIPSTTPCKRLFVWRTNSNLYCEQDWWPGCNRDEAFTCTRL